MSLVLSIGREQTAELDIWVSKKQLPRRLELVVATEWFDDLYLYYIETLAIIL